MMIGSAATTNIRRIQRYLMTKTKDKVELKPQELSLKKHQRHPIFLNLIGLWAILFGQQDLKPIFSHGFMW